MKRETPDSISKKGVSPFIASVLTILFGVLMLGIVLGVVNPTFKRVQDSSVMSDAFQNLNLLNTAIKEVASEAQDSKRTISISVSDGEYSIDGSTDMLVFEYEPSHDMGLSGTKGSIEIERGSVFMDFFNWYVDGDLAAPVWTNTSGEWTVDNLKYKGNSGLAYHNLTTLENYKFSGKIYNSSGTTGGQMFVLPTNPERLVGFWTFDNRTGDQAYDWTGDDNNGTLTNMNTIGNSTSGWQSSSDCKAGVSCLMFDGVNDYVNCGNDASLDIIDAITIAAWVKPMGQSGSVELIVSKSSAYYIRYLDSYHFRGTVLIAGEEKNITSNDPLNVDVFSHVVFAYNGINLRAYINGVQEPVVPQAGDIDSSGSSVMIGGPGFNGTIDEVMIFNVSLTADEVLALYETSVKKLVASGSQSITNKTPNAAIVLANPYGVTSFDDIKVSRTQAEQKLVIPYSKIDLNGTLRIGKGEHKVQIEHMGTNTTLSKPIIEITAT